ncbi:MAG: oligosaccharide flippase family protein, partial [Cyclobacteriaceae bacterium]
MFKRLRHKLLTDTNKNSLVLLYGTVLSQLLPLLFSPVLARLYTPAEFGAFSLFYGIVAILGNISAGKLDLALYTAGSHKNAVITAASGLTFCVTFSAVVFIACLIAVVFFSTEKLSVSAIVCIPLTVSFLGGANIMVALSNREKKFMIISRAKMILGAVWVLVNILLGFFATGAIGLIFGYCLGQFFSMVYLLHHNKDDLLSINFNSRIFKFNVIRNKNYSLIFLPAHLLNTASASAPAFFLSYLFSLNANGFFFKAARVGESPTNIIRNSLGNIFWQQASHNYITHGNARQTMQHFLLKLLFLGL